MGWEGRAAGRGRGRGRVKEYGRSRAERIVERGEGLINCSGRMVSWYMRGREGRSVPRMGKVMNRCTRYPIVGDGRVV